MSYDILAEAAAASQYEDQSETKSFSEGFTIAAEGPCPGRMVSYIEYGRFPGEWKGKAKENEEVFIEFELSGPKHEPIKTEDGRIIPTTIGIYINKSLGEKAGFTKLFKTMNYDGKAKHFADFLNKTFLLRVTHNEVGTGENKKTYANLRDATGAWGISNPTFEHPVTNEKVTVEAAPRISPIRYYNFGNPSKGQWDSIFIDGVSKPRTDKDGNEIEPGKSRNRHQLKIMQGMTFKGSPAEDFAKGLDALPFDVDAPERSEENKQASVEQKAGASNDPLAGLN
jgi:hypothetical protein